ncbi:nipped-B-like protein scc-2 [Lycorma delicatula]|uniref:nipped-B-like protein scc-2 n=1 Tax=Lycorma delicatula TaxID=130591 RepID=UPI003F50E64B
MEDKRGEKVSEIIQEFIPLFLKLYPHNDISLRHSVARLMITILEHGMMPVKVIPVLIAVSTETDDTLRSKAAAALQKVDPTIVQMSSMQGIVLSYKVQVILKEQSVRGCVLDACEQIYHASNETLYLTLKGKQQRKTLLQSMISTFSSDLEEYKDLYFLSYIADNLAYFPYDFEELHYVIEKIYLNSQGPTLLTYVKKKWDIVDDEQDDDCDEDVDHMENKDEDLLNNVDFHFLLWKIEVSILLLSLRKFLIEYYGIKDMETVQYKKCKKAVKAPIGRKGKRFCFFEIKKKLSEVKTEEFQLAKLAYSLCIEVRKIKLPCLTVSGAQESHVHRSILDHLIKSEMNI